MSDDASLCRTCGAELCRRSGETTSNFHARRTCNRACRDAGYARRLPPDPARWWRERAPWPADARFTDHPAFNRPRARPGAPAAPRRRLLRRLRHGRVAVDDVRLERPVTATEHTIVAEVPVRFTFPGLAAGEHETAYPKLSIRYRYTAGSPAHHVRSTGDQPDAAEVELIAATLVDADGLSPEPDDVRRWAEGYLESDDGRVHAIAAVVWEMR